MSNKLGYPLSIITVGAYIYGMVGLFGKKIEEIFFP